MNENLETFYKEKNPQSTLQQKPVNKTSYSEETTQNISALKTIINEYTPSILKKYPFAWPKKSQQLLIT